MDKYTGAKTIGDGTYGSVLKAINKQNGKVSGVTFHDLIFGFVLQVKSSRSKR